MFTLVCWQYHSPCISQAPKTICSGCLSANLGTKPSKSINSSTTSTSSRWTGNYSVLAEQYLTTVLVFAKQGEMTEATAQLYRSQFKHQYNNILNPPALKVWRSSYSFAVPSAMYLNIDYIQAEERLNQDHTMSLMWSTVTVTGKNTSTGQIMENYSFPVPYLLSATNSLGNSCTMSLFLIMLMLTLKNHRKVWSERVF